MLILVFLLEIEVALIINQYKLMKYEMGNSEESVIPITKNSRNQQYMKQVREVPEPETNHVSGTNSLLVVQGKYEMILWNDRVLSELSVSRLLFTLRSSSIGGVVSSDNQRQQK
jgi:hypothetical protein